MADSNSFAKLVPGFEFLQSLTKNAGSALPNIGHWVAPTLNPEEIEKRIEELRTVKFWLEQNGRMLDATIQALEVQRMTLTTLKTMNVQMGDLRESMMIRMPGASAATPAPAAATAPSATANNAAADVASSAMAAATSAAAAFANAFQFPKPSTKASTPAAPSAASATASTPTPPHPSSAHQRDEPEPPEAVASPVPAANPPSATQSGAVDPMQWWGALTKQFTALATSALQESVAPRGADRRAIDSAEPAAKPRPARAPAPRAPVKRSPLVGSAAGVSANADNPARKKPARKTPGR